MNSWLEEKKNEFDKELAYRQELLKIGLLTFGEFDSWLEGYLSLLPFQFAQKSGYRYRRPLTEEQWKRLQEDYALWKEGRQCSSTAGDDWLYVMMNDRGLSVEQMKAEFFESRDSFMLGITDLEPVPADIECSGLSIGMPYYPQTLQWLLFDSQEMIHLFDRPDEALGNTYRFTMQNGIYLQIKIEHRGKDKNPQIIVLEGTGYLSEYMMPLNHTLRLRNSFETPPRYPFPQVEFCFLSEDDLHFYYDSPRFQPYFAFCRARDERTWQETQKLYAAKYGKYPV